MTNLKGLQIRYPISLAKNLHAHDQFTKGARCVWLLCSFPLSKIQKVKNCFTLVFPIVLPNLSPPS